MPKTKGTLVTGRPKLDRALLACFALLACSPAPAPDTKPQFTESERRHLKWLEEMHNREAARTAERAAVRAAAEASAKVPLARWCVSGTEWCIEERRQ